MFLHHAVVSVPVLRRGFMHGAPAGPSQTLETFKLSSGETEVQPVFRPRFQFLMDRLGITGRAWQHGRFEVTYAPRDLAGVFPFPEGEALRSYGGRDYQDGELFYHPQRRQWAFFCRHWGDGPKYLANEFGRVLFGAPELLMDAEKAARYYANRVEFTGDDNPLIVEARLADTYCQAEDSLFRLCVRAHGFDGLQLTEFLPEAQREWCLAQDTAAEAGFLEERLVRILMRDLYTGACRNAIVRIGDRAEHAIMAEPMPPERWLVRQKAKVEHAEQAVELALARWDGLLQRLPVLAEMPVARCTHVEEPKHGSVPQYGGEAWCCCSVGPIHGDVQQRDALMKCHKVCGFLLIENQFQQIALVVRRGVDHDQPRCWYVTPPDSPKRFSRLRYHPDMYLARA